MKSIAGQITIASMIGWGLTIAIASVSGYFTQSSALDGKINGVAKTMDERNIEVLQRVATLEEAISTIKQDNKTMQGDIKEILRILR